MARIYVASLSDYNAGRLHGVWIDLEDKDSGEVWEEINAMLAKSPEAAAGYGPAEEVAIHDYEGFYSYRVHEYEGIGQVVKVAEFLSMHGIAGAAWLENDSSVLELDSDEMDEAFSESYQGHYDDKEDFAFNRIQDFGEYQGIPFEKFDENYRLFDWEEIAGDMLEDCYTADDDNSGIHIFSMR